MKKRIAFVLILSCSLLLQAQWQPDTFRLFQQPKVKVGLELLGDHFIYAPNISLAMSNKLRLRLGGSYAPIIISNNVRTELPFMTVGLDTCETIDKFIWKWTWSLSASLVLRMSRKWNLHLGFCYLENNQRFVTINPRKTSVYNYFIAYNKDVSYFSHTFGITYDVFHKKRWNIYLGANSVLLFLGSYDTPSFSFFPKIGFEWKWYGDR
jgi:hypothetical protein